MNANERRAQECEKAAERDMEANKTSPSQQEEAARTTTNSLVDEKTDLFERSNIKGRPTTCLLLSDSSAETQVPPFSPSMDPDASSPWPIVSHSTSPLPTISEPSFFFVGGWYTQQFTIPNGRAFTDSEISKFERCMAGYTLNLTTSPELVEHIPKPAAMCSSSASTSLSEVITAAIDRYQERMMYQSITWSMLFRGIPSKWT